MDAKDILGIPKISLPIPQENKSRPQKGSQRKPDGISLEVYALTGGVVPLMPSIDANQLKKRHQLENEKLEVIIDSYKMEVNMPMVMKLLNEIEVERFMAVVLAGEFKHFKNLGLGEAWSVVDVSKGSTVAIFGLGNVGLFVAQGAKIRSTSRIIGVDTNPEKKEKSKAFGVTDFINPNDIDETVQQAIKRLTDGGVDYSFECIGDTEMINTALHSCYVTLGVPKTNPNVACHYGLFLTRRTLKGSLFGGWKPKSDIPRSNLNKISYLKCGPTFFGWRKGSQELSEQGFISLKEL
ncbi:hypothetical protein Lser_V15G33667 [Lactuca serriola]